MADPSLSYAMLTASRSNFLVSETTPVDSSTYNDNETKLNNNTRQTAEKIVTYMNS